MGGREWRTIQSGRGRKIRLSYVLIISKNYQVSFKAFIEQQKEEHALQLEAEKLAREKAKKETLLQETRYGAKPSTPAKLKGLIILIFLLQSELVFSGHNSTAKTPRKFVTTPSASRIIAKVVR